MNRALFANTRVRNTRTPDAINLAGGAAYAMGPEHSLVQFAMTGTFQDKFYSTATEQLATMQKLCAAVSPKFVAQTAIYAREKGHMKDMPSYLCAYLLKVDKPLLAMVFPRVIDSTKMLSNFVQFMRSGQMGTRTLASRFKKRLIRSWLVQKTDDYLFRGSVGNDPSLADVIRLVHAPATTPARKALFAYLLGYPSSTTPGLATEKRSYSAEDLPDLVKQYEAFKSGQSARVPALPFEMLAGLSTMIPQRWVDFAKTMSWQTLRQNLSTLERHGVFSDREMAQYVAMRLADPTEIARARIMPYQLLAAYMFCEDNVPIQVKNGLQVALDTAIQSVPTIPGQTYVLLDISGSMKDPATGHKKGATSKMRHIDIAALIAAAVLRQNKTAEVLPFNDRVRSVQLNPFDSVMTNTERLASMACGSTACSAPLEQLNRRGATGDLLVFVSDNESWVDACHKQATAIMEQFELFKRRSPKARMICIDLEPSETVQAHDRADILNIGGFSDEVFTVLHDFAQGAWKPTNWVEMVKAIEI